MSTARADMHTVTWNGMCFVTPLIGGWLADAYIGRYRAIIYFSIVFLVGLIGITLSSQEKLLSSGIFFFSLYVVALGTGGIKPNVSTFGADQFDDQNPVEAAQKEGFFNWFYFSINVGAFVSFTVIAYICQNVSFAVGYVIPTVVMALSILIFVAGKPRYTISPPAGSTLSTFFKICWEALVRPRTAGASLMDKAKVAYGGSHNDEDVEDAKSLLKLFPFLGLCIVYNAVYSQMSTTFFNQGCQMDLRLPGGVMTPVAALSLFDTIIVIVLIPLLDRVAYPLLHRCGYHPTLLQKIGFGFAISVCAMIAAGFVEMGRLSAYQAGQLVGPSICVAHSPPQAVDVSVLWQIPQFTLIGASEVLSSVTAIHFFYSESPDKMKSVVAAFNLFTMALGTWSTAVFISLGNAWQPEAPWIADDANKGKLHYYFFMLAAFSVVNLLMWIWAASRYTYKADRDAASAAAAAAGVGEPGRDSASAGLGDEEAVAGVDIAGALGAAAERPEQKKTD
eukprot:CAMPEP_0175132628 /NCGR_PEP_ID=MMETSP0087-20121206/7173_1 /TAXON_ID=136419 /ORGANISM="Unknown Unknown, Strain D1" /LENGTH=505 /DNA_ID=CAMNT_0016414989 /DNA_START=189 /DNA_END=1706 /DNA_ORIENTATION=-